MIPQTALTLMRELTAVEERMTWLKTSFPRDQVALELRSLNRDRKRIRRKLLENPHRNP